MEAHHILFFSNRITILRTSKKVELFDLKGPQMDFFNKGILFYHFKPIVLLNLIVRFVLTIFEKIHVDEQLYVITKSI